jgi:hypothetical protein
MTDTKTVKTTATFKDVYFYYTSVNTPSKQLNPDNKPAPSQHPLEFHSFEIKILVPEKDYKQMKKEYKGAKNFDKSKDYDVDDCKSKLNLDVDDDMVLIKFAQTALVGKTIQREDGTTTRKEAKPVPQFGVKGKVQDRNGLEVVQTTELGYGTKGHLQVRPVKNDFGLYLYPNAICVTDLVEFTGAEGDVDMDEFGIEELDDADIESVVAQEADLDESLEF